MITFIDLKDYLAPYVDGGVCPDDPRVKRTVDEAIERLVNKPALAHKLLLRHVKMTLRGSYLTLPRCFDRILKARIDGARSTGVYSVWYEFLSSGPGPENMSSLDLVDSGEVCTQYDPPEDSAGYYMIAFSDSLEDAGKEVFIRGLTPTGAEVRGPYDAVGETLKLSGTAGTAIKSFGLFTMITNVRKPATVGYVFLAAVSPTDGKVYHLASYGPTETSPSYRRYQINGLGYDEQDAAFTADLKALVKMRPVPITHDTDFLLVSNRACLKAMCQAIYYYDKGDAERGAAYEVIAEKILMDETISYSHEADDGFNIQAENWAPGEIPALI
jgi:hypothetical protein